MIELTYWKLRFKPDGSPFVTAEFETKPLPKPDCLGYEVIGQNAAIKKTLDANPNLIVEFRNDPATFARYLTAQELASKLPFDQAQYVGGAIDIVSIGKDRAEWLQRKRECPRYYTVVVAARCVSAAPQGA